jgi:hypothetical protein
MAKTTLGRVSGSRVTSQTLRYRERLWVPWWWWLVGLGASAVLAKEVNMGVRTLPDWLPYAVLAVAAAGVLLWLSRTEVRVISAGAATELWAGQAHLPASVVSRSAAIPRSAKSAALGRQLDPAVAHVGHEHGIAEAGGSAGGRVAPALTCAAVGVSACPRPRLSQPIRWLGLRPCAGWTARDVWAWALKAMPGPGQVKPGGGSEAGVASGEGPAPVGADPGGSLGA